MIELEVSVRGHLPVFLRRVDVNDADSANNTSDCQRARPIRVSEGMLETRAREGPAPECPCPVAGG